MSNYEQECENFALFGDPLQEAMDYEFNAQYDYRREAYGDTALNADWEAYYDDNSVEVPPNYLEDKKETTSDEELPF